MTLGIIPLSGLTLIFIGNMTNYKVEIEPINIEWIECDSSHEMFKQKYGGISYELLDEKKQVLSFPDINRFILVKTKNGNIWRTIVSSEFERKHLMMRWYIKQWCYE